MSADLQIFLYILMTQLLLVSRTACAAPQRLATEARLGVIFGTHIRRFKLTCFVAQDNWIPDVSSPLVSTTLPNLFNRVPPRFLGHGQYEIVLYHGSSTTWVYVSGWPSGRRFEVLRYTFFSRIKHCLVGVVECTSSTTIVRSAFTPLLRSLHFR